MKHVKLPRPLVNRILSLAQRAPDREICGLISARDNRPLRCIPIANTAEQPERLFTMDPAQQIDAMRQMREQGETLFAIYHSHPTGPAEPSVTDIEQAGYPEALHLIVSLNTEGVLELSGYRFEKDKAMAVHLEILED
ncbi:Mov34/MPN/PAD-1 family protein [hydrothermal vent metagenome]|uniref:Mov34/MPN/PAD-1 family protein n=1 Tax=hydrothermal vent metagenome TaxID=652676 RepID=A0A3B0Y9B7_9ZZZZ